MSPALPATVCSGSGSRGVLTIDQLLQRIGEFGLFQKLLDFVLFCMNIPVAYQILIMYFAAAVPSWKCHENSTTCTINGTRLGSDRHRCEIPKSEWYYLEDQKYSIVTEFRIDCDKEWLLPLLSSAYFIGWGIGGIILGNIGDRYGRKFVLFPSFIATIVLGFLVSLLHDVYAIIAFRLAIGFFNPGSTLQAFILVSEYVGSKQRSFAGIIVYATLPIGYIIVALKAYLTKNWRTLHMICTLPYIATIVSYKFVPESIKWLLLHRKINEIKATVTRIQYWNKTSDQSEGEDGNLDFCFTEELGVSRTSVMQLFQNKKYLMLSLVQGLVWLSTGIAYFGLSFVADDLGGTTYRDFIILSVFELPALALAIHFNDRFGRKPTTLVPLICGGIASLIVAVIPMWSTFHTWRVVLGIVGKFCLSVTFDAVYTWSVEIYPTSIRSKGMGFLQAVSHFGSAGAPWIAKELRHVAAWLPFVAMGTPALVGFIVGAWLPETNKKEKREEVVSRDEVKRENTVSHDDLTAI